MSPDQKAAHDAAIDESFRGFAAILPDLNLTPLPRLGSPRNADGSAVDPDDEEHELGRVLPPIDERPHLGLSPSFADDYRPNLRPAPAGPVADSPKS
jgi:hypothetical protein